MRSLKSICNKAINLDYAPYDWYPFRNYIIKKEKTTPRVISIEEVQRYFALNLVPSDRLYKSWCIGKLIFLLQGINLCDLLKLTKDHIKNGRIIYKRSKTHKIYSVKMLSMTKQLLEEFSSDKNALLSSVSDDELKDSKLFMKHYSQKRKNINTHLTKIGKIIKTNELITTYVFRYSYANIAKQLGYSKDIIAEALGHEYGNSVTGIYLEMFDNDVVDNMNEVIVKNIINIG
ncbi:Phage integrase family protein [compost metagenome]